MNQPPAARLQPDTINAHLAHVYPALAARVVQHVASALDTGGELFAIGRMLDDSRLSPPDAVAVNVMFLIVYEHGQAYTEGEYRAWFSNAGLRQITRQSLAGGYSILRGVKS